MNAASSPSDTTSAIVVLIFFVIGLCFYFLPSIVATVRKVPNTGSVFVLNLFLGWTIAGWVIALAMAFRDRPQHPTNVQFFAAAQGPLPRAAFPNAATPGVGWHPDPLGHHRLRYHDGQRWTEHVA